MFSRRHRLVPVAVFEDRSTAEDAWSRLQEAGIPAAVVTDPGALGSVPVSRVYVAKSRRDESVRIIADLVV